MQIRYYEDKEMLNNKFSIFLAGPTPRSTDVKSWRKEAIEILKKLELRGGVDIYIPEPKTGKFSDNLAYSDIIEWEHEHLERADVILFWVPRELKTMPAFTTNVEFGMYLKSGKIVYGRPDDAPNNRYLDYIYSKNYDAKPFNNLEDALKECVSKAFECEGKDFFTSDTHFGSERTLKFSNRNYKNAQEMDQDLISKWNQIVKANDKVFHLGDFGNYEEIKKLNGKVTLIMGNYEEKDLQDNFDNNFDRYKNHLLSLGFEDVIEKGLVYDLNGEKIYLTHRPLECKKDCFNLFGHIHEKNMCKRFGLNVGVDSHKCYPCSKDEIMFYKNAIENHYDEDVFVDRI